MSRRDLFHQAVVHALEREGWTCVSVKYYTPSVSLTEGV